MNEDGTVDTTDFNGMEQQGNPAWTEVLQDIPQEFHPKLTPHLEKWDKGVQEKLNQVHSEYEPWKQFIKNGVEPDTANFALNLLNTLNDNPQMVYQAIGDYYNLGAPNPTEQGLSESKEEEDPYNSRIANLERQNQIMAQTLIARREQELQLAANARAEAELDAEIKGLQKKYGEFDEEYVLSMMDRGKSGEQAVQAYMAWREKQLGPHMPKPLFMGSGGGFPNQNADPRKMNEAQRKDMVIQLLQANAHQQRQ